MKRSGWILGTLFVATAFFLAKKGAVQTSTTPVKERVNTAMTATPASPAASTTSQAEAPADVPGGKTYSQEWFDEQVSNMNAIDPDPQNTLTEMKSIAAALTPAQTENLTGIAVINRAGQNERIFAVHLLLLNPKTPVASLIKIAAQDDPAIRNPAPAHSPMEFQSDVVKALAIAALEEIQKRAVNAPTLIYEIERIGRETKNSTVAKLSREMIKALKNGRLVAAEAQ